MKDAKDKKGFISLFRNRQFMTVYMALYDVIAVYFAFGIAMWLRFDCQVSEIPEYYVTSMIKYLWIYALIVVVLHGILKLYRSVWRFASYAELNRTLIATVAAFLVHLCITIAFFERMPISYYVFGTLLQFAFTFGIRISYRFFVMILNMKVENKDQPGEPTKVMLIGAGQAGQLIMRDLKMANETNEIICCIIDDDPNLCGRYLHDTPIVGGRDQIMSAVIKYGIQKIYLAIPSATMKQKQELLDICKETGCQVLNLPGIYQLTNGEVTVSKMREVAVEDLLGREPIKVNVADILQQLEGKTILVTGGGGSIGSELCRQIAYHNPKKLIIYDIYENNAYDIQQELKRNYPMLNLEVIIGSVRDSKKLYRLFEIYRPEIVYHAAAHKHVPLMEDSPCEAIKNNSIGTYKTAFTAMLFGCKRFVLISTDKAVNPTNIMGASKRLCEMIIQSFDAKIKQGKAEEIPMLFTHLNREFEFHEAEEIKNKLKEAKTEFVAVRFGNVLGSNGSVVPLFKRQIAAGGPVTVTHPDIIRYFMTIPEAVSLVLQAGTYAHGGEIFVLDMGEPVRVDDMARNLIKLSGLKPGEDIKIEYTGLRPGEKLFEEKLMAEEGIRKTENELIHIGCPIKFDTDEFLQELSGLMRAANANVPDIREKVQRVVTTYHPAV